MSEALPELKKGSVLRTILQDGRKHTVIVRQVGKGRDFEEPVYFLTGSYGAKLKTPYTGEELASMGYKLRRTEGNEHDKKDQCDKEEESSLAAD